MLFQRWRNRKNKLNSPMKKIKLKPTLGVGDTVEINGEEYVVEVVSRWHERKNYRDQKNANVRQYQLINGLGERETLLPGDIEEITVVNLKSDSEG